MTITFSDKETVAMVEAIKQNPNAIKSKICDAFAEVVFQCENTSETWGVLKTLQEYTHLIGVLSSAQTLTADVKN